MKQYSLKWIFAATTVAAVVLWLTRDEPPAHFTGPSDGWEALTGKHGAEYPFDAAHVGKTPGWNPSRQNPPISARRALQLADEHRRENPLHLGLIWQLKDIQLKPLDIENHKWCWKIECEMSTKPGGSVAGIVDPLI